MKSRGEILAHFIKIAKVSGTPAYVFVSSLVQDMFIQVSLD